MTSLLPARLSWPAIGNKYEFNSGHWAQSQPRPYQLAGERVNKRYREVSHSCRSNFYIMKGILVLTCNIRFITPLHWCPASMPYSSRILPASSSLLHITPLWSLDFMPSLPTSSLMERGSPGWHLYLKAPESIRPYHYLGPPHYLLWSSLSHTHWCNSPRSMTKCVYVCHDPHRWNCMGALWSWHTGDRDIAVPHDANSSLMGWWWKKGEKKMARNFISLLLLPFLAGLLFSPRPSPDERPYRAPQLIEYSF